MALSIRGIAARRTKSRSLFGLTATAIRRRIGPLRFNEPSAALISAEKVFLEVFQEIEAEILDVLIPAIEATKDKRQRTDAIDPEIERAIGRITLLLARRFREPESLLEKLRRIAKRVESHNGEEWKRVIGINPVQETSAIAAQVSAYRARNIGLIESLSRRQVSELKAMLENPDTLGLRVEAIRDQIQERFNVTRSKAALLARDQTLKLNGQITKTRHEEIGGREYVWSTSRDERVRRPRKGKSLGPDHVRLEGTRQSWDNPPIVDTRTGRTAHPGDDYQCRCIAVPIIPELDTGAA